MRACSPGGLCGPQHETHRSCQHKHHDREPNPAVRLMAQVVDPGPSPASRLADACGLDQQPGEGVLGPALHGRGCPVRVMKKAGDAEATEQKAVAAGSVCGEHGDGGRVERDEARWLPFLPFTVSVASAVLTSPRSRAECFSQPQPGGCDEADQRLQAGFASTAARVGRACRVDEGRDLLRGSRCKAACGGAAARRSGQRAGPPSPGPSCACGGRSPGRCRGGGPSVPVRRHAGLGCPFQGGWPP